MITTGFVWLVVGVGAAVALLQYLEMTYPCVKRTNVIDFVAPRFGVAIIIAICQFVLDWPVNGGSLVTQAFAFLGVITLVELLIRIVLANFDWMLDPKHWREYRLMNKRKK
jgi:hypothetical protein